MIILLLSGKSMKIGKVPAGKYFLIFAA